MVIQANPERIQETVFLNCLLQLSTSCDATVRHPEANTVARRRAAASSEANTAVRPISDSRSRQPWGSTTPEGLARFWAGALQFPNGRSLIRFYIYLDKRQLQADVWPVESSLTLSANTRYVLGVTYA